MKIFEAFILCFMMIGTGAVSFDGINLEEPGTDKILETAVGQETAEPSGSSMFSGWTVPLEDPFFLTTTTAPTLKIQSSVGAETIEHDYHGLLIGLLIFAALLLVMSVVQTVALAKIFTGLKEKSRDIEEG